MKVKNLNIGQKLFFKRRVANLSGYGTIVRIYENETYGISYMVLLDDGRVLNRVEDSNINPKGAWSTVNEDDNPEFNYNGQTRKE